MMNLVSTIILDKMEADEAVKKAMDFNNGGADELLIWDVSNDDASHDKNIGIMKKIADAIDIPMLIGGQVKRLEDVKKYIYAGGKMAVLDLSKDANVELVKEASERFGTEQIAVLAKAGTPDAILAKAKCDGAGLLLTDSVKIAKKADMQVLVMGIGSYEEMAQLKDLSLYGILTDELNEIAHDKSLQEVKHDLKNAGFEVNAFESAISFSEFKLNSDGLIPVVVQDYKTNEVLMMAYMNEEAFDHTMKTGRMTYYSRSRQELWEKGLTSGHFQYVKELRLDCDNDTILAKVYQVGAACHTGSYSCFFKELAKKEYENTNPLLVFKEVFDVILDRKEHPKEGSYTNYLFDKGIDKILKKVGEEATEIVIAAKNPDPEEIKYEISDFLYHVMVLMAERGVTWEEITKELSRR